MFEETHIYLVETTNILKDDKVAGLELLCSISSFAREVKIVSFYFAWFYFCILTAGFKAHRIPNFS